MDPSQQVLIVGGYGSPYSRKMRAVLRYRRIPHRWVLKATEQAEALPKPAVDLIPVLIFPDSPDQAEIDSTPLIRRLERLESRRSVIPPDPALALLDALIEDYADEWLTKPLFYYRWGRSDGAKKAARVQPLEHHLHLQGSDLEEIAEAFTRRQVGRLEVVGCSPANAPVIKDSYLGLLRALDPVIASQPFLMGQRPGASDFGVYGQLSQLTLFDPRPAAIATDEAPRLIAWVHRVDDLSWLEVDDDGWLPRSGAADALRPVLQEVGRYYAPFMLANQRAVTEGLDAVECEIDDRPWRQRPFKYQAKCLGWLRDRFNGLGTEDRAWIEEALEGTGCGRLFG